MFYSTVGVVIYTQCCTLHSVLCLTLSVVAYTPRSTNTALCRPQSKFIHHVQISRL